MVTVAASKHFYSIHIILDQEHNSSGYFSLQKMTMLARVMTGTKDRSFEL
jgi:hypothetical protein